MAEISPKSGLKKVPTVVPRGALYGAIQLASKQFSLHQSATKVPQTRHLFAPKRKTETPSDSGFPA